MKNSKNIKRLSEPGVGIHLFFMILFAVAALYFKQYLLAAAEGGVILVLLVYGSGKSSSRPISSRLPTIRGTPRTAP